MLASLFAVNRLIMVVPPITLSQPRIVAVVIGQAFSTAYKEYLKSRGVTEESMEREEYNYVLHSQVKSELEVNLLKDDTKIKEVNILKHTTNIDTCLLIIW